ncbi:MAG: M20/M25/M40 family metallo-hydrolase [Balneolaceae bacterium]
MQTGSLVTLSLISLLFLAGCESADRPPLSGDIRQADLKDHIYRLADPGLEGRLAGTKSEARAANYIADHFREFELEPGGEEDIYFQFFPLAGPMTQAMGVEGLLSRNVIGIIPGRADLTEFLIIGAHYDAQGMGGIISLGSESDPVVHPGADDNASGTAGLLELARYFSANRPTRTLVFIAFSGEELGLLGSRFFVENPTLPEGRILAMINLDMIGRMEEVDLTISGTGSADIWPEIISVSNRDSLNIRQLASGSGASDHDSFYDEGIPALHYFAGSHPDYHRPGDTAGKINYEKTAMIVSHVKRVIAHLDTTAAEELIFEPAGYRTTD